MIIDDQLSFELQVDNVCKKVFEKVNALSMVDGICVEMLGASSTSVLGNPH